jgi:hypothetical protein
MKYKNIGGKTEKNQGEGASSISLTESDIAKITSTSKP